MMSATYSALGRLLTYPDAELQASAEELAAVISAEGRVPVRIQKALNRLVEALKGGDIYSLQEQYVDLFDRSRSLSLNLYEHVHGESRDRGEAMAGLLELYRSEGLELATSELPDHLPVFLEFLSLLPADRAASLLSEAAHVLEAIGERLHRRGSSYRSVFGALAALAGAADAAAVAALLSEPDPDPDDLTALDEAWEDTPVTFGPDDVGCPKADALVAAMNTPSAQRPSAA